MLLKCISIQYNTKPAENEVFAPLSAGFLIIIGIFRHFGYLQLQKADIINSIFFFQYMRFPSNHKLSPRYTVPLRVPFGKYQSKH